MAGQPIAPTTAGRSANNFPDTRTIPGGAGDRPDPPPTDYRIRGN